MTRHWFVGLLGVTLALILSVPARAQSNVQRQGELDALNECLVLGVAGMGVGGIQVTGTYTGTVTWTVSVDGGTYVAVDAFTPDAPSTAVNSTTSTGVWTATVAGLRTLRACMTAYTSGRATIHLAAASTGGGGGGAGGSVIVDSGTLTAVTTITNPVTVTDGAGALNVICDSGCAGGTQYAVDTALGATPTGTLAVGIRDDALSALTPVEGDAIGLRVDANGALWVIPNGTTIVGDGAGALNVICDSGCSGGTQYAEDAIHTTADLTFFVSGIRRDTTPSSSAGAAGDYTAFNIDANGRLYVNATLYNSSGTELTSGDATHDSSVVANGPQGMLEAKDFDGAALPNAVSVEGDAVRAAGSLSGVQYMMLVSEDGSLQYGTTTTPFVVGDGAGALNVIIDSGTVTTVSTVTSLSQLAGQAIPVLGTTTYTEATSTGPLVAGVRNDTLDALANTTNEAAPFQFTALGSLWTAGGGPCDDPARITTAAISESTAATNEIVALTASNLIAVCSYKWVTTAANSLSWSYGTGTDCATGTTAIEGAQPYAANGGVAEQGGGAPLFVVPSGQALCLVSSVATAHGGRVSYVKSATLQ